MGKKQSAAGLLQEILRIGTKRKSDHGSLYLSIDMDFIERKKREFFGNRSNRKHYYVNYVDVTYYDSKYSIVTVVTIYDFANGKCVNHGLAACSRVESFSKKLGLEIAYGRALKCPVSGVVLEDTIYEEKFEGMARLKHYEFIKTNISECGAARLKAIVQKQFVTKRLKKADVNVGTVLKNTSVKES
jgi:hypothetical protein